MELNQFLECEKNPNWMAENCRQGKILTRKIFKARWKHYKRSLISDLSQKQQKIIKFKKLTSMLTFLTLMLC